MSPTSFSGVGAVASAALEKRVKITLTKWLSCSIVRREVGDTARYY